jgi:hypothetical protein
MSILLHVLIIGILTSCTFSKNQEKRNLDVFDKIFEVRESQDLKTLESHFGKPQTIELSAGDPSFDDYYFPRTKESPPINVFVNRKTKEIYSIALTYWVDFDAYAFLKKRFKDYKWIETELPIRTDLDYAEELHKVEIPELGISFEYDNQDPLRRPMWIFFKGKE